MTLDADHNEVKQTDITEMDNNDLVISDLEPDIPDQEGDEEYVPDKEFEEDVDYSSYLKVNYYSIS